jgi:Flp pilus assembly protein TadG
MLMRLLIGMMIIVALALGATFYSGYLDQSSAADALVQKNNTSNLTLSKITKSTSDVESEIADISAQINKAQNTLDLETKTLPAMTNSNAIVGKILTFGDQLGVTVIPLNTRDWASIRINKNDFHVFRMSVEVNGPQQKVVDYVKRIQDSLDQYLVVEKLEMSKLETASQNFTGPAPTEAPVISSFAPTSAYTGQNVIITGSNFTGTTNVSFGTNSASSYIINSDNQITAVVAIGASGDVSVVNAVGTTSLSGFTYTGATPPLASPASNIIDTKVNLDIAIYAK